MLYLSTRSYFAVTATKGVDMDKSKQPALQPKKDSKVTANWQREARIARDARVAAQETRKGRPVSFTPSIGTSRW